MCWIAGIVGFGVGAAAVFGLAVLCYKLAKWN